MFSREHWQDLQTGHVKLLKSSLLLLRWSAPGLWSSLSLEVSGLLLLVILDPCSNHCHLLLSDSRAFYVPLNGGILQKTQQIQTWRLGMLLHEALQHLITKLGGKIHPTIL